MAAVDSPKKPFWRKGNNTKLPGRPQQIHRSKESHSTASTATNSELPSPFGTPKAVAGSRGRTKTFEEYTDATKDAWEDADEDFPEFSGSFEPETSNKTQETATTSTTTTSSSSSTAAAVTGMKMKNRPASDAFVVEDRQAGVVVSSSTSKKKGDLMSFFNDVVKPRSSSSNLVTSAAEGGGGGGAGGGGGGGRERASSGSRSRLRAFSSGDPIYNRSDSPCDFPDVPDRETTRLQKFGKLMAGPNTDLDELRKLSWSGIPPSVRATTWQLLCGYLPPNIDWREETLQRKRLEYRRFIEQYYHTRLDPTHNDTFRQIHIDVPRMNPEVPLFQQQKVQECFERILFIWSIRHPASGYVQGINDLVTPFFIVFLSYYISGDKNPETFNLSSLPEETLKNIEADSFWCMQKLLEGIQDNYTLAQPGVQTKIMALKDLMKRLDASLDQHFEQNKVEYIQFAFRWMNNLLMREFPLRCVIRVWDSYLSERDGFAAFHVYVCAALLEKFSADIRRRKDFQDIMLFIQSLPTSKWTDSDIELLLAEAFQYKFMFADAPGHLNTKR